MKLLIRGLVTLAICSSASALAQETPLTQRDPSNPTVSSWATVTTSPALSSSSLTVGMGCSIAVVKDTGTVGPIDWTCAEKIAANWRTDGRNDEITVWAKLLLAARDQAGQTSR